MDRKWTPGPWVMDEENQGEWGVNYSIQMANNRLVDVAEMVGTKEDANIIAAAPDLYEALEGMLRHSCVADAVADMKDAEDHAFERIARSALAKASGE